MSDIQVRAERLAQEQSSGRKLAPTLVGGLKEDIFNAYRSPPLLGEAFLDRASVLAKEKGIHYQEIEQRLAKGHEIKSESSSKGFKQWGQGVEQELKDESERLSKLSTHAKLGALSVGVVPKVMKVVGAKPEERPRKAMLASAEFAGEEVGMRACEHVLDKMALDLVPESRGVSLLLIPAVMVVCGGAAGSIAKHVGESVLDALGSQSKSPTNVSRKT